MVEGATTGSQIGNHPLPWAWWTLNELETRWQCLTGRSQGSLIRIMTSKMKRQQRRFDPSHGAGWQLKEHDNPKHKIGNWQRCCLVFLLLLFCCYCLVAKLCLTLWPMDCSPPDSSVHGISKARILEWVAISFSRWSSQPGNQILITCSIGRWILYHWVTREAHRNPKDTHKIWT